MIIAYMLQKNVAPIIISAENQNLLENAIWIDLFDPSKEEEHLVETILKLNIPTRFEMQEIELSSRLYSIDDAVFMTVIMIAESDSPEPKTDAVTFILKDNKFISVRYIDPQTFKLFTAKLATLSPDKLNAVHLFIELLDIAIDRLADILEKVSAALDNYSKTVFKRVPNGSSSKKPNYRKFLQDIGASGDLYTKVQESLITFERLTAFFMQDCASFLNVAQQSKLDLFSKDINSLNEHILFLSNKINFLLDATLGMINIDQNDIIKIFSIVAVILLPPTLVASIYGMNFHNIPELSWQFGYPFALTLMIISAWLPYKYFKKKKWL